MLKPTQAFLNNVVAQLVLHAAAGPYSGALDGLFLGLYQAPTPAILPSMELSDFVEADYTGYARQAIVWRTPYVDGTSMTTLQSTALFFHPTDGVTPNTIAGLFVCDAIAAGNLVMAEFWGVSGALSMADATKALSLAILFQLDASGSFGSGVVIR